MEEAVGARWNILKN